MESDCSCSPEPKLNVLLLAHLYLLELCAAAVIVSWYRLTQKTDLVSFVFSYTGLLFLTGVAGILWSGIITVRCYLLAQPGGSRSFSLTLAMNLITVFSLVATLELTVRLISANTIDGQQLLGTMLLPRDWNDVIARYSPAVRKVATENTFYVYDELLGWTVGPDKSGDAGRYLSSVEGIRSARSGLSYGELPVTCRIALVGDSFTFGYEVAFEESWGYHLERAFHSRCQVLNFGVPGYGVDQAYLRYVRDVRPWHPDVIVFGLINDDIARTLSAYSFLIGPDFELPFAKPRFTISDDRLTLQNVPVPMPEQIFSRDSIKDLPLIQLDQEYHESEWERPSWRYFYYSYLFRLVTTLYPRWEKEREETSFKTLKAINRSLIKFFVQIAQAEGSVPLVVYLPEPNDYQEATPHPPGFVPNAIKMLREAAIPHVDLTPCITALDASKRFAPNGHYSPEGNLAIAGCLHDIVRVSLAGKSRIANRAPSSFDDNELVMSVPLDRSPSEAR